MVPDVSDRWLVSGGCIPFIIVHGETTHLLTTDRLFPKLGCRTSPWSAWKRYVSLCIHTLYTVYTCIYIPWSWDKITKRSHVHDVQVQVWKHAWKSSSKCLQKIQNVATLGWSFFGLFQAGNARWKKNIPKASTTFLLPKLSQWIRSNCNF